MNELHIEVILFYEVGAKPEHMAPKCCPFFDTEVYVESQVPVQRCSETVCLSLRPNKISTP